MGRYAQLAEDYWRAGAPEAYRAIKDKPRFFDGLATEAQRQIDEMLDSVLTVEGEPFASRARRLRSAHLSAEEIVTRELLTPPQPEQERLHPTSGLPLPDPETPDYRTIREALADFHIALAEWHQQAQGPRTQ
jgi:hypothetical protein